MNVYTALLEPNDIILSLDIHHGGHLFHGYQTPTKKFSAVSKYFESMSYHINKETGTIDYDTMERSTELFHAKIIVSGASSYDYLIYYKRTCQIYCNVGAYVLSDMAHISGIIASEVITSCFPCADVVTTTTHNSLCGTRGAMILYRKVQRGVTKKGDLIMYDIEENINFEVFPYFQGGPHNHTIGGLSTCLKQVNKHELKEYQNQVLKNFNAMGNQLNELLFDIVIGGTDNHIVLVDLKSSRNIDGSRVGRVI